MIDYKKRETCNDKDEQINLGGKKTNPNPCCWTPSDRTAKLSTFSLPFYQLPATLSNNPTGIKTRVGYIRNFYKSSHLKRLTTACLQQHVTVTNAPFSSADERFRSFFAPQSLFPCAVVVIGCGRGDFLTSASSVLPIPALSTTAAPAAAPAVASPAGAAPAPLMALPVGVAAAFPVPIKVTALALVSPPLIAVPVWMMRS